MMDELTIGLSAILSIGLFDITEILTHFENAFLFVRFSHQEFKRSHLRGKYGKKIK